MEALKRGQCVFISAIRMARFLECAVYPLEYAPVY